MKKLILMLLVLVGGVMQANAAVITIYFKPNTGGSGNEIWKQKNERYAYNTLLKSNTNEQVWVDFVETYSGSGMYKAEYNTDNYTGRLIICRMDGSDSSNNWNNKWAQSGDLPAPTTSVYYDKSTNYYENSWTATTTGMSVKYPNDYSSTTPYIVADPEVVNGSVTWYDETNTPANNSLVYQNDFTFKLNVTRRLILGSNYRFKVFRPDLSGDSRWCGDPANSGDNFPVAIASDGYYTITYTYNILTGQATATPTLGDAVTMRYFVYEDTNPSVDNSYVSLGEMNFAAGTASLTVNNKSLTMGENTLLYKIVCSPYIGETLQTADQKWQGGSVGAHYNFGFTPEKTSVYNVTFTYNPITSTPSVSTVEQFTGYYLIGNYGTDGWVVGDALTQTGDVYSITVENNGSNYYRFDLVPNTSLNSSNTLIENNDTYWGTLVRPDATEDVMLGFANVTDAAASTTNSNQAWQIPAANTTKVVFSYNKANNTWSVAPYFTKTINGAQSGEYYYATFSDANDVAIPENVVAYYATDASNGTVNMTAYTGGIKGGQGAFLRLPAASNNLTFTPASGLSAPETNLLKAGTAAGIPANPTGGYYYVFANQTNGLGFYKVGTKATGNMEGKAYLLTESAIAPAPYLSIDIDGETTHIGAILNDVKINDNAIYDLSGRRVAEPTKGVYIVNGKKVVIK